MAGKQLFAFGCASRLFRALLRSRFACGRIRIGSGFRLILLGNIPALSMRCETRGAGIQLALFLWARAASRAVKIERDVCFGHSELIHQMVPQIWSILNSFRAAVARAPTSRSAGAKREAKKSQTIEKHPSAARAGLILSALQHESTGAPFKTTLQMEFFRSVSRPKVGLINRDFCHSMDP